jgi:hypothetical protein
VILERPIFKLIRLKKAATEAKKMAPNAFPAKTGMRTSQKTRVARFFFIQYTKTVKNVPNFRYVTKMAFNHTKCL